MKLPARLLIFALLPACAAYAQFSLYQVNGGVELPVGTAFDFGAVDAGAQASVPFRIRNTSANPATLAALSVGGVGFSLTAPAVPVTLASEAALDFTVTFQGATAGLYSAGLEATGISVLLMAEVQQGLSYAVSTNSGWQPLITAGTPVSFGSVAAGAANTVHFLVQNPSALYLTVPAISVQGQSFALAGTSPSGLLLGPQQNAAFDIVFTPPGGGTFSGSLRAGNLVFALGGIGIAPPLPAPSVTLSLAQNASAQQGTAAVTFAGPVPSDAAGSLSLSFQPLAPGATDPAIAFASGSTTVPFTVAAADTQAQFGGSASAPFQTGTTAGTLVLTASVGNATAQQSIVIPPAPVTVTAAQASRGAGSITLQLIAFDNTRSAGKIAYTFFDAQGNPVLPGAITVDSSADFAAYFASSTNGGVFSLTAVFPVSGDAGQIKSFQVQFTNSAGTSLTPQTQF